jgi:hypothetical protein
VICHQPRFTALHMTDHVPFYPSLPCKRFNFCYGLFRIILSENVHTCLYSSLNHFKRLRFRYDHQTDFLRIEAAFARGRRNLVEGVLVIFAYGGNEVEHERNYNLLV